MPTVRLVLAVSIALFAMPSVAATPEAAGVVAAAEHYGALLVSGSPTDVAAAYAPEGELMLPGQPPIHGRAALTAMLTTAMQGAHVLAVEMHVDSVAVSGTTATASGTYRQTAAVGTAAPAEYRGQFEGQWQREGQQWLIGRMTMKPE